MVWTENSRCAGLACLSDSRKSKIAGIDEHVALLVGALDSRPFTHLEGMLQANPLPTVR